MPRPFARPAQLIASLATISLIVFASTAVAQKGKAEEELMQIERDWCNAAMKNDVPWFTKLIADDAQFVSSTGERQSKTQFIADVKAEKYKSCQVDQMQVRVYGDTGVVTGRWTPQGTDAKGKPFPSASMFTDTFVRNQGQWQVVASQSSVIAK